MGHDALRVSPGHLFQRVSCLCSVHSRVVIGQSLLDASSAVQATGIEQLIRFLKLFTCGVLARRLPPPRLSCDAGRHVYALLDVGSNCTSVVDDVSAKEYFENSLFSSLLRLACN